MDDTVTPNADQQTFWDRQAGPKWVRLGAGMDRLLAPVLEQVLSVADLAAGDRVLDVGCGGGTSSFAAAQRVGAQGHVTGADISESLLHQARTRAAQMRAETVTFDLCDVQTHGFAPGSFDAVISRFGVMFFADPVAAFANMARAMRPGGRMTFASWGQIPENPYFTVPAQVARAHFDGSPPKVDPDGPGPFAFRDPDRIRDILTRAEWTAVEVDVRQINLTPSGGAKGLAALCAEIGPVERAFDFFDASQVDREAVNAAVAEVFAEYETDGVCLVPAEINLVTARVASRSY